MAVQEAQALPGEEGAEEPFPLDANPKVIDAIDGFVTRHAGRGTPRNQDTLLRMREAIDGMRRYREERSQEEREKK